MRMGRCGAKVKKQPRNIYMGIGITRSRKGMAGVHFKLRDNGLKTKEGDVFISCSFCCFLDGASFLDLDVAVQTKNWTMLRCIWLYLCSCSIGVGPQPPHHSMWVCTAKFHPLPPTHRKLKEEKNKNAFYIWIIEFL